MKKLKHIWVISLLVKLVISAIMPLSPDEAYYWVWSHKLQLSYFDHPPMIAWLIYLGHFLEPFHHAVRWPAVILGHCTLGLGLYFLKGVLSMHRLRWWMYLVLFSPLLGFGSIVLTPDLPIVFFWMLSLLIIKQILEKPSAWIYACLGASLGLGFCAKYHIVLFLPCLIAFIIFERKWTEIIWKWVPLTFLFGLIFSLPVLWWNFENDFASFNFQLKHGLQGQAYDPAWTTAYIGGQLLIVSPWILWASLKSKIPERLSFIPYFSWLPLVFFFITSFRAPVEANWAIIALPGILILAVFHENIKRGMNYYIGFWSLLIAVTMATLFIPSVRQINEKLSEPYDLAELSQQTSEYIPLYTSSYQIASSLWYNRKMPIYKLRGMSRYDFFDTLDESMPKINHFYLITHKGDNLPDWLNQDSWTRKVIKSINPNFVLLELTQL